MSLAKPLFTHILLARNHLFAKRSNVGIRLHIGVFRANFYLLLYSGRCLCMVFAQLDLPDRERKSQSYCRGADVQNPYSLQSHSIQCPLLMGANASYPRKGTFGPSDVDTVASQLILDNHSTGYD